MAVEQVTTNQELLRVVVAAKAEIEPREAAFRVTGIESYDGATIHHDGFYSPDIAGSSVIFAPRQRIEDLHDQGFVRLRKRRFNTTISPPGGKATRISGEQWEFDVLPAAITEVRRLDAVSQPIVEPVHMTWKSIEPVLRAVFEAYPKVMPGIGVSREQVAEILDRKPSDMRTVRALYELERAGYITVTMQSDAHFGPSYVELTEKSFRLMAGWPGEGSDATATALLDLIQKRLEAADTDEERSRWVTLREGVLGLGHDVLVELLAAVAQTGAHKIGV